MKLSILAILVGEVISQGRLRISQGPLRMAQSPVRIKTFANGEMSGEPVPVSKSEHSLLKYGPSPSSSAKDLPQFALGRRTAGALLGALSLGYGWSAQAAGSDVKVVTFDGAAGSTHNWLVTKGNAYDPFAKDRTKKDTDLLFRGESGVPVGPVPVEKWILKTVDGNKPWPDVSSCEGISMKVKNINTRTAPQLVNLDKKLLGGNLDPEVEKWDPYKGYFISFGKKGGGYKAKIDVASGDETDGYKDVKIPFNQFTNAFDPATGLPTKTCKDSPEVCPDKEVLQNLKQVSLSAEGVAGRFRLIVNEIGAYGCKAPATMLATVEETSDTLPLVLAAGVLAAIVTGLLVFVAVSTRARPAPIALPLLG